MASATPLTEACRDVQTFMNNRAKARMQWGLSAIHEGLTLAEGGRHEEGLRLARHGAEFLKRMAEARDE